MSGNKDQTNAGAGVGVGVGTSPKDGRFKPGKSGNPRGRPPKRARHLLPRQMREDILRRMKEEIVIETPAGPKKMTISEITVYAISRKAMAGNPTAMKLWLSMMNTALEGRLASNGALNLLNHSLEWNDRERVGVHRMMTDPDFDLAKATRDLY